MGDFLSDIYPWPKALHLLAVISWMAGLLYLPRLFVYHVEHAGQSAEMHETFNTMERKLFRFIMNPAMIASWVFGLLLIATPGIIDWGLIWPWAKAALVIAMTWYHHLLGRWWRALRDGQNTRSGRFFRMVNEIPAVLMIGIVLAVVIKP